MHRVFTIVTSLFYSNNSDILQKNVSMLCVYIYMYVYHIYIYVYVSHIYIIYIYIYNVYI